MKYTLFGDEKVILNQQSLNLASLLEQLRVTYIQATQNHLNSFALVLSESFKSIADFLRRVVNVEINIGKITDDIRDGPIVTGTDFQTIGEIFFPS